ncbi:MAG: HAD family hydrolase [Candidatus Marsarchaeota archaeon]
MPLSGLTRSKKIINGIIFDMDGTLLDSREAFIRQITDFFIVNDIPKPPPSAVAKLVGKSYSEIFEEALGEIDPAKSEDFLLWMNYSYRYFYINKYAKLFDGAYECVKSLIEMGYTVGIATNAPRMVLDYFLERYGFERLGVIGVSGDDVVNKKPSPDMLLKLQDELGVDGDIIYVGDMNLDVEAAHKAGMISAAVLTGLSDIQTLLAARPDVMIQSVTWICKILGKPQGILAMRDAQSGP